MKNRAKFIVFEGIDGSGKSTQTALLSDRLKELGIRCHITHEPTDSPFGSSAHQIMTGRIKADERVTALMFAADRLDHLTNETDGICSVLNQNITVLCDRYYFSSYAYNSVNVELDWVMEINRMSAETLRPDMVIFIDLHPDEALKRMKNNRVHSEIFETRERLEAVRKGYLNAFKKFENEENIIIIDGNNSPEKISEDIWRAVKDLYEEGND